MDLSSKQPRQPILDPVDRVTEVIFGLLMAMTFVGALSVATSGREEARTMLIAAFGCNLAWGLADAVMYLLRTWTERTRNRNLLWRLQTGASAEEGRALIADALPARMAAAAGPEGLEKLRQGLLDNSAEPLHARLGGDDVLAALGIFLLVVLATFPVVIPFLLIQETALAIRLSNLVAVAVLFAAGWLLARYSGATAWAGGALTAVVGTVLILAIIALGG
ncbi:hypothetical protein JQX08_06305 [Pseudomonas sp. UL073]|uniref:VIT family protein n=1 Tax=Zestomonas insulae TaxID=2809017 RepID=A0ABS2IB91_9GAMM|nr:hypothetical protein [Pseudomonas insulae]MBM7060312.1 hypothetical protein [Pseudomonas insulae]